MIRITLAAALLCALTSNAEARQRHRPIVADPGCNVIFPCIGVAPSPRGEMIARKVGFGTAQNVYTPRRESRSRRQVTAQPVFGGSYGISRPRRYIGGRLVCAINVNSALAERGIQGTGSALAKSFDRWGVRVTQPIPGAVAVTDRRGGGHVAIVSRVEGGRVFVYNPSRSGWMEIEYTHRHARYRVAG